MKENLVGKSKDRSMDELDVTREDHPMALGLFFPFRQVRTVGLRGSHER